MTVQIGTVLLFAVLIVLLSTYQASVVPQQNEEVEFDHNQQVQSELQDLRDEIHRTAVSGSGGSSSVALGTRYPVRAFFVNPPPPAGSLETTPPANAKIVNAEAAGETGDYWTGDSRSFSTRGLVYDPGYHVYQNPPTTTYRGGVLYNRFESANITLGGQRLIEGNAISLVALNGSYDEAGSGTASVDLRAISPAVRTVTVSNETATVSVVVPTKRPASEWEELLADQIDGAGSDDRYVLAVDPVPGRSAVEVVLEPATYELRLAKVGVGTDVSATGTHYVTDVRGNNASVPENSGQQLVVEVRDRFNNPVSGATLNATLVSDFADDLITAQGQDGDQLTDLTTDAEGRVTVSYDAPDDFDDGNEPVEVRVGTDSVPSGAGPPGGGPFAPGTRANLSFNLTAVNADGSGLAGGGGGNRTYDVNWTDAAGLGLDCDAEFTACTLNANQGTSVSLTARVTEDGNPVSQTTVDYAVNDSALGSVSPPEGVTDGGTNGTTLDVAEANGTITAYAASGDDVDPIKIRVEDPPTGPGPGPDPTLSSTIVDQSQTGSLARYEVSYDVDNTANFGYVRVSYENLDAGYGDQTYTSSDSRLNIDDYGWSDEYGDTGGDTYEISIEVFDTDGNLVDSRTVTDPADGTDPSGNDDLTEGDSPTLQSATLYDLDPNNVEYALDYQVSDPAEKFSETEVLFLNTDSPYATDERTGGTLSGNLSYTGYSIGDQYEVLVQVQDDDGIVVDQTVVEDEANGDGGGGASTSDERIRVVDGSTPAGESDHLTFDIENVGESDVRITDFNLTTPGRRNSGVRQVGTLDTPNGDDEVRITGGGTDGYATPDYGKFDEAFAVDGTTYALARQGNRGRGQEAVVTGGSTATVEMGAFNGGDIQLTYELTDDSADADLVATLVFDDGTVKPVYVRVTNVNS